MAGAPALLTSSSPESSRSTGCAGRATAALASSSPCEFSLSNSPAALSATNTLPSSGFTASASMLLSASCSENCSQWGCSSAQRSRAGACSSAAPRASCPGASSRSSGSRASGGDRVATPSCCAPNTAWPTPARSCSSKRLAASNSGPCPGTTATALGPPIAPSVCEDCIPSSMARQQAREIAAASAARRARCRATSARWRTAAVLRKGDRLNRLGSPGWRLRRPG